MKTLLSYFRWLICNEIFEKKMFVKTIITYNIIENDTSLELNCSPDSSLSLYELQSRYFKKENNSFHFRLGAKNNFQPY